LSYSAWHSERWSVVGSAASSQPDLAPWNVVRAGIPTFGVMLCLAALAPDLAILAPTLLVFGTVASTVDVSMNAEGAVVERRSSRPLMSGFHTMWSLGLLTGALVGVGAAGLGIRPMWQFAAVAIVVAAVSAPALAGVAERGPAEVGTSDANGGWSLQVALLGLIAFSAFFAEGAAADWSAVLCGIPWGREPRWRRAPSRASRSG
jgi:hypothetical protein